MDNIETRKNIEDEYFYKQGPRRQPVRGILIYDQARKKLDISESGKLYRQKWWSYVPIIGPICSIVYANFCLGKVKCLRNKDAILFNGTTSFVNLFAFLFWPLLFLGLWTLFSFLVLDFGTPIQSQGVGFIFGCQYGLDGSYSNLWNITLIDPLSNVHVNSAGDFFNAFSLFFGGLSKIFIFPLLNGPHWGEAPANLIFILIFVVITVINPVNIYNSFTINRAQLRFTIVYETNSIYQYR